MGQRYWAWATRTLLHRGASLTRLSMVIGTFPIWWSRAGSLMWDWRGWAVMRLEEGFRCKAVPGWGSWRGVGRRSVDVLHCQTQVQVRQAHRSGPVWGGDARRSSRRAHFCKPATGGVTAGRAHTVPVGSQSLGNGVWDQTLTCDRFTGWGDLDPGAGSVNGQWFGHHPRGVEGWSWKVFCGGEVLTRGQRVWGGHVGVMVVHQCRWLVVFMRKSSWIVHLNKKKTKFLAQWDTRQGIHVSDYLIGNQ